MLNMMECFFGKNKENVLYPPGEKQIKYDEKVCKLVYKSFESGPSVPKQKIQWKHMRQDYVNTVVEFRHILK